MVSCSTCKRPAEWRRKADGAWVCDICAVRPDRIGPHDYDEDPGADEEIYDHKDALSECEGCEGWFPDGDTKECKHLGCTAMVCEECRVELVYGEVACVCCEDAREDREIVRGLR